MKDLTTEQKINIYKDCIKIIESGVPTGICDAILNRYRVRGIQITKNWFYNNFKELVWKKPKDKSMYQYWFKSKEERVKVLNDIIKKLENRTIVDKIIDLFIRLFVK